MPPESERPSSDTTSSGDLVGLCLSGRFRIERRIGKGGTGEVYLATDEQLDRKVAVKVLSSTINVEPHRRRFLREARLAARLHHPNIAAIHEVGESDGRLYIVMELLEGETLRELLNQRRLSEGEALSIARDIARAMARAHAGEVVHRDIKPENVMITHPSSDVTMAKVLDFGLARDELMLKRNDEESTATDVNGPGEACGTAGYLAPEQARGLPVDARADVFSFGAVAYEMFTGKRAFDGRHHLARMLAVVKNDPTPLRKLAPDLDPALEEVIVRCLAKSPDDRYDGGASLVAALDNVARSASQRMVIASAHATPPPAIRSMPPTWVPRSQRWLAPALVGASMVVVGGALIAASLFGRATTTSGETAGGRLTHTTPATSTPSSAGPNAKPISAVPEDPAGAVSVGFDLSDIGETNTADTQDGSHAHSAISLTPPTDQHRPMASEVSSDAAQKSQRSASSRTSGKPPIGPSSKTAVQQADPPSTAPTPIAPTGVVPTTGVVRFQQNPDVMTVVVDGEHRRLRDNAVTLPCGRHRLRVGLREERIIDVPCGGALTL